MSPPQRNALKYYVWIGWSFSFFLGLDFLWFLFGIDPLSFWFSINFTYLEKKRRKEVHLRCQKSTNSPRIESVFSSTGFQDHVHWSLLILGNIQSMVLNYWSFHYLFDCHNHCVFVFFFNRRTRAVFDAAVSVHKSIQQRDIEVGRNLGNWILRWLDRMKPSANIRGPPEQLKRLNNGANSGMSMTKQVNSSHLKTPGSTQIRNQESDRHMFSSMTNALPKTLPSITMMMRARKTSGTMTQYRNLFTNRPEAFRSDYTRGGFGGIIRKDIMQWMQQNW